MIVLNHKKEIREENLRGLCYEENIKSISIDETADNKKIFSGRCR